MSEFSITAEQRQSYRENGFIQLDQVFNESDIRRMERDISAAVMALYDPHAEKPPNSDTSAYEAAFTQVMNIWRHDDAVRALVFNRRLARIAAELMGVNGVRLYHDQALYKAAGGGITPWHCDQYYWPIDSDNTITAWIPLQDTAVDMGALAFSAGSHLIDLGRNLPIGQDSERVIEEQLQALQLPCVQHPFRAGDVSFHAGWTFHRAAANQTNRPRRAMTVIYFADGSRLKQPENANQEADREQWCPGARVGEVIATGLNPILYKNA